MIKKLFILIFAVLSAVSWAIPTWAAPHFVAGDKDRPVVIETVLDDDTYIGARTVVVNSNVDGDLIIGANDGQLNGQVGGDLWVGAGAVTVNGRVTGDVRIGGGEVIINTTVDDDVIVGAGRLTISDRAVIRGELIVGSGEVTVNGHVLGGARIAGGAVILQAVIDGDVEVRTDNYLSILPGTKIGGQLTYWAPQENLEFSKYAQQVIYHPSPKRSAWPWVGAMMWMIPAVGVSFLLWKLICVALLGAVIIWLMPKLLPRVATIVKKNYWRSFWLGLLITIGGPILMLLLAMTLIGVQLMIVVGLVYGLLMIFGYAVAVTMIGSWLIKKIDKVLNHQLGAFIVGSILFGLIGIVPGIGWLISFGLLMMGVGGFWQDRYQLLKSGKY